MILEKRRKRKKELKHKNIKSIQGHGDRKWREIHSLLFQEICTLDICFGLISSHNLSRDIINVYFCFISSRNISRDIMNIYCLLFPIPFFPNFLPLVDLLFIRAIRLAFCCLSFRTCSGSLISDGTLAFGTEWRFFPPLNCHLFPLIWRPPVQNKSLLNYSFTRIWHIREPTRETLQSKREAWKLTSNVFGKHDLTLQVHMGNICSL